MPHELDRDEPSLQSHGVIELRVRESIQLFDALDPSPFREKDLDRRAEDYIVESAKELPGKGVDSIIIRLDVPIGITDENDVADAIHGHFRRQSKALRRELRQLMRRGLISLGIGVTFLAAFFVISQIIGQLLGESNLATLFREGMLIVGWVAMWRPLEIFLYDWWPIAGRRRLAERLSATPVRVVLSGGGQVPPVVSPTPQEAAAIARWETEGGHVLPSSANRGWPHGPGVPIER